MLNPGYLNIQIIDYTDTSGSCAIDYFSTEGTLFGNISSNFQMKYPKDTARYETPIILRALARDDINNPPDSVFNSELLYTINGLTGSNDDWYTSPRYPIISGLGLGPSGINEGADLVYPFLGDQYAYLDGSTNNSFFNKRGKLDMIRVATGSGILRPSQIFSGSGTASQTWISYDMSTGMNNKNIFSYQLTIIDSISGNVDQPVFNVQNNQPSRLLFQSGAIYQSLCNTVGIIFGSTGSTCLLPTDLDGDEPKEICVSTGLLSGSISGAINDILAELAFYESQKGDIISNLVDDSAVTIDSNSLSYTRYKGIIEYNQPFSGVSGDSVCFESYNYDYTGTYNFTYAVNPPYPTIKFCWNFGSDYNDITGLANLINTNLQNINSYNLWLPGTDCIDQRISGYYETGALVKATVSGSNYILLDSLRDGPAGKYKWTFPTGIRPSNTNYYFDIIKYMRPAKVTLQGALTSGNWTDINVQNDLNWGAINPTIISAVNTITNTGIGMPVTTTPPIISFSGEKQKQLIYKGFISGTNKCGAPFSKEIDFYQPINSPTCTDNENDNDNLNGIFPIITGIQNNQTLVNYYLLKTGFKFSNTGNYNYYRLVLDNLTVQAANQNIKTDNSVYVDSIKFFGVQPNYTIHSGSMCLFGAAYSGQVMGITTGRISGTITGQADGMGKVCFSNQPVTGIPNGNGNVLFNRLSGLATTPFTGLANVCVTGTGFYLQQILGYFYDSGNQCINYYKPISGYITGSGTLSGGPYNIIYNTTMAKLTGSQLVVSSGEAIHQGLIYNFNINLFNAPAFGRISGVYNLTLTSGESGSRNINDLLFGLPNQIFSIALSGTKQATAVLNYNTSVENDCVVINGLPIFYDTGLFSGSSYFNSINTLNTSINSQSSGFNCTGYNDGTKIYLTSLINGRSGNSILISTTGGATKPTFNSTTFTGGVNYHFPLTAINYFSGYLSTGFNGTGYFVASGTGILSGQIKQLDFIRTFTGLWDLTTGTISFRNSGFISGGNYQNSGFTLLSTYSGINIFPFQVNYDNSPVVYSQDLALLTITGFNSNTGISIILSGKY